jgi:hypothetical protein
MIPSRGASQHLLEILLHDSFGNAMTADQKVRLSTSLFSGHLFQQSVTRFRSRITK